MCCVLRWKPSPRFSLAACSHRGSFPWCPSQVALPSRPCAALRLCLSFWVASTALRCDGSPPLSYATVRSVKAGTLLLPLELQHLDLCQVCSACTVNISWINYIRQNTWLALMEKWSTAVSVEQRECSLGIEEGFTWKADPRPDTEGDG